MTVTVRHTGVSSHYINILWILLMDALPIKKIKRGTENLFSKLSPTPSITASNRRWKNCARRGSEDIN